ncbi:hypothetical protein AAFF_G00211740 [Aldrovandia affinis]|uniref:L27 domain-containing protein n=1 Tax=Aldrovandia affinis TaxID=143900 RepID=A0AAD7SXI8_9TELE|nr:hypothetical protein AAFF_G00211740 [Aldrovandia affinis]
MRQSIEADPEAPPGLRENGLVQILANVVEEVRVSISRDINGADLLYSLLNAPWLQSLLKVYECLQQYMRAGPRPFLPFASGISQEVMAELRGVPSPSPAARELYRLLRDANMQALLSAHDTVAQKDYDPVLPPLPDNLPEDEEAMRIVCLVKNKQPLRSVGGATRSRWDKLRRLTKDKLGSGRRAGSLEQMTGGATACRVNYVSPERLCTPLPNQPCPLPLYKSIGSCRVCRQSSALSEDGLYHSAPSVCSSVLFGNMIEEADSGEDAENRCPLSPPPPRRKLPYQPYTVGTPYFPACYSTVGRSRGARVPMDPPGYGRHAHTAPSSPMQHRRAVGAHSTRSGRHPLTKQESLDELRSTVHTAASTMERSSDDVRALGQKMVAATEMMSESVQENAQALGLLMEVVDKLRGLIVTGRSPAPLRAAPRGSPCTPPACHARFLSSSSSSSSGSFCVYRDSPALSPGRSSQPYSGFTSPKGRPKNMASPSSPHRHANARPPLSNGLLSPRPAPDHSKMGCLFGKKEKKKKK